jgi:uncharacterized RDD family membrane protein YckC
MSPPQSPLPGATAPHDSGFDKNATLPVPPPTSEREPTASAERTGVVPPQRNPALSPAVQGAPAAMLDRTGVIAPPPGARVAPPSPTEYAAQRPSAQGLPQVTPMRPFEGALPPSDHRVTPNRAQPTFQPAERQPVPLGAEDELDVPAPDEPKTVPAVMTTRSPTPAPVPAARAPSLTALPPAPTLPAEMLVTQPGLPGPFAARGLPQGQAVPQRPPSLPELRVPAPPPEPTPAFVPAPVAPAHELGVTAEPASLWRRVGAWLTDLLFVGVMVLGLLFLAIEFVAPKNLAPVQQLMVVAMPAAALTALIAFVYTALFAFLWDGRTPGRRLMGIHLVDATGQAPSALRSLIRAALSLVSFALFLSGFWLALFDRHGQTLHDKLTRTFVVKLQDA